MADEQVTIDDVVESLQQSIVDVTASGSITEHREGPYQWRRSDPADLVDSFVKAKRLQLDTQTKNNCIFTSIF